MEKELKLLGLIHDGYCVSELSTGEIIIAKHFRTVYQSTVLNLKSYCHMYRKRTHGSCSYSAVIHCPSGFVCEITVYDFNFYKGVAVSRGGNIHYLAENER